MVFAENRTVMALTERSRPRLDELPRLRTTLLHAIDHDQSFSVCCMCSIIGELMFASLDPTRKADKFPKLADLRITVKRGEGRRTQHGQKRNGVYYLLAALRHTCFHPAMTEPIRDLPRAVFREMSSLHTMDAADWSLEQLDAAFAFDLGRARPFSY
jgi:hypothetical protein